MALPGLSLADATAAGASATSAARRVEAGDLPAWIEDLQAGHLDLDHALAGAVELRDGVRRATSALAAAVGSDPPRALGLVAALLGPRGGAGEALAALGAVPGVLIARPVDGEITSTFGRRRDPIRRRRTQNHKGIDVSAARGTPVHAAGAGVVVRAHRERGYGRVVYVDHGLDGGRTLQTRYAHLQRILVKVGQEVAAGQRIGAVGSSGRATGSHLHFEVRLDGAAVPPRELADLPLFGHEVPGLFDAALAPLAARAAAAAREQLPESDEASGGRRRGKPARSKGKAHHERPARRALRSEQPRS